MMIKECNQLIQSKHRMSKDIVTGKEEINCNNIIKQVKNDSLWRCHKRKHKRT